MKQRIVEEARTWLRTPYHHHQRVKGAGVDCAQILIAVFAAVGLIDEFDPGAYAHDWHLHRSEEIYAAWLDRYGDRVQTPEPGDVVLYRFGRTYSHGGIVAPEGVIHAYIGRGVIVTRADEEPLSGRQALFWRVRPDGRLEHD